MLAIGLPLDANWLRSGTGAHRLVRREGGCDLAERGVISPAPRVLKAGFSIGAVNTVSLRLGRCKPLGKDPSPRTSTALRRSSWHRLRNPETSLRPRISCRLPHPPALPRLRDCTSSWHSVSSRSPSGPCSSKRCANALGPANACSHRSECGSPASSRTSGTRSASGPSPRRRRYFVSGSMVPDERIPGTLNVGYAIPTVIQAYIYTKLVPVDSTTLILMIAASVLGAWLGAGVVSSWPRRTVQICLGLALLAFGGILVMKQTGVMPPGGDALGPRWNEARARCRRKLHARRPS